MHYENSVFFLFSKILYSSTTLKSIQVLPLNTIFKKNILFIYSCETHTHTHTHTEAATQAEGEAGSMQGT